MRRRQVLGLVAGTWVGIAGCLDAVPDPRATPTAEPAAAGSVADASLPVPESQLHGSVARDAIPAIVDPVFGDDWSGLEITVEDPYDTNEVIRPRLEPTDRVIGVERDGEARAYPLKLLNWHEVVNDTLEGPLLVTYCPLCRSGLVAVRRVAGRITRFGVSGDLWRSNLVLYDGVTESLWSQVAATAIRGPQTGEQLDLLPSRIVTWEAWQNQYPGSVVLLPPPESNTVNGRSSVRDYNRNPYTGYETSRQTGPGSSFDDDRLHPKALVIGVTSNGTSKAYPLAAVAEAGVVNDTVGDRPVVVAVGPGDDLVAYGRRVDGRPVRFERVDERLIAAGGSRFRIDTGEAVDGPFAGHTLRSAAAMPPLFWFSWLDFHPDSELYTG